MSATLRQNPFKGVRYYEEKDKDFFYGRDQESNELFQLVKTNFLVLVSGKSGTGKTSLVNAGLFPRLRPAGFLPVRVAFDYTIVSPPLSKTREAIRDTIKQQPIRLIDKNSTGPAAALKEGETLWEYFHRVKHEDEKGNPITPVLVFDSFGRLFTGKYHQLHRELFLKELVYLVENRVPEHLWGKNIPVKGELPNVRLVLVIRDDCWRHLETLKKRIPTLDRVHYQLLHLNGIQARQVLDQTGAFADEKIKQDILQQFYPRHMETGEPGKDIPDKKLQVEPGLLSLFCAHAFETGAASFSPQDRDTALALFYNRLMWEIPHGKELAEFIETRCLTISGARTAVHLDKGFKLRDAVEAAVDLNILRKIYYEDKEHVEISHNLLLPIIKEQRSRRLEEKRERQLRQEKRRRLVFAGVLVPLLVLSLLLVWYSVKQEDRIENLENQLESQLSSSSEMKKELDALINLTEEAGISPRLRDNLPPLDDSEPIAPATEATQPVASREKTPQPERTGDSSTSVAAVEEVINKLLKTATITNDKQKAIRIVEAAYKIGLPEPPPQVFQVLSELAYSGLGSPFYETIVKTKNAISAVILSPDGSKLINLLANFNNVEIWDLHGNLLTNLNLHTDRVNSAVFSPDGRRVLTASDDKTARLWDLQGNLVTEYKPNRYPVYRALFSPDGKRILTTPASFVIGNPKIWDLYGKLKAEIQVNDGKLKFPDEGVIQSFLRVSENAVETRTDRVTFSNAVFSPDGKKILTVPVFIFNPSLWDLQGNLLAEFPQPENSLSFALFSSDGSKILTTSSQKTAVIWNQEGARLNELNPLNSFMVSGLFSPDGSRVVTIPYHPFDNAKIWDRRGDLIADLQHSGRITSAVFSPDGSKILTASEDRTAKLWDLEGTLLAELKLHKGRVVSAVFSPDGSKILTASEDRTAKLWDIQGNLLADLKQQRLSIKQVLFLSGGTRLLTVSGEGVISTWYTPQAVIEWLKSAPIPKLTPKDEEELGIAAYKLE